LPAAEFSSSSAKWLVSSTFISVQHWLRFALFPAQFDRFPEKWVVFKYAYTFSQSFLLEIECSRTAILPATVCSRELTLSSMVIMSANYHAAQGRASDFSEFEV
jgi:hypothetical protein